MQGALMDWIGGALVNLHYPGDPAGTYRLNQPIVGNYPSMSLQEFGFWKWRVRTLHLTGSLTINAIAYTVDCTMTKGFDDGFTPANSRYVAFERDMGRVDLGNPDGTIGRWLKSEPFGPGSLDFEWFSVQARAADVADFTQGWAPSFSFYALGQDEGDLSSVTTGWVSPVVFTIEQDDPALVDSNGVPLHYEHDVAIYYGHEFQTASGSLTLTAYTGGGGFWPWMDVNGVATYNIDTGALL